MSFWFKCALWCWNNPVSLKRNKFPPPKTEALLNQKRPKWALCAHCRVDHSELIIMNYSLSHTDRYRAAIAARNINRKCKVWKWRKQIVEFLREGCFHLFPHEHHCVDRNTKLSHFLLLFELARKLRMTMIFTVYNSTQRHFFFFLLTGCDWNQTESGAMHHARKCFIWKETHGKLLWIKMIFRGNMVKFWDFCPFWQIFYNFIIADLELKIFVFKCQPQ